MNPDDSIAHIGLPPRKEKAQVEEKKDEDQEDPRLWTPQDYGEYVGAIDRGNGWEPAVMIEGLQDLDEDSNDNGWVEID